MDKILITGGSGRIGSDLTKFFSKDNKVYATFRKNNSITKNLRNKNIFWIKHDIKNSLTKRIQPNIIIHCAGVHPSSKNNNYKDYISSNIIGLSKIIDFAKKNKIKKIFHLSSIDVYGNIQKSILNESSAYIEPSIFGCTKLFMERMISFEKIDYLNIRLPGVVGYQVNDYRGPWLCKIVNKLLKNKKIEIFNGNKSFNNILDTYEIYKFINYLKKKTLKRETVNLSACKAINLKKLIFNIKKELNSKSKILIKKNKSKHFIISNKKLINLYNYKLSTTSEIIRRYIRSFKI